MNEKLLLFPILIPIFSALLISSINFNDNKTARNIFIECLILFNTFIIFLLVMYPPANTLTLFRFSEKAAFALRLDGLGTVFAVLIATLWPLTALYAFEYMNHEHRQTSFFGWFTATYGIVAGIALSSDLLTLYLFYELMTFTCNARNGRTGTLRRTKIFNLFGRRCSMCIYSFDLYNVSRRR